MVKWKYWPIEDATWEVASKIQVQFPAFDPWGQGSTKGGGIDMNQVEMVASSV